MSKKKSKTRDHGGAARPASREEVAQKALDAGRFREAIEVYKELLKTERRAEWVESLALAYAGRAEELQAKSMIPEALTIWRNRATACGKPLADAAYIDCLCLSGASADAFKLIAAIESPAERTAVETRLAAMALLLSADGLAVLPADSLLRRHHASAVAALGACSAGDAQAVDAALREIPFRSPYRDLNPVLKALGLVQTSPAQAQELLTRVGVDSPFARLAAVVRVATLPDDEWLPALAAMDNAGQQILLELKGCPAPQRPRLLELARLGPTPAPEKVLAILLRSRKNLSPHVDALCLRLLPLDTSHTREISEYSKCLPPFEEARADALRAENTQRGIPARERWLTAISTLGLSADDSRNAAMILQRVAIGSDLDIPLELLSDQYLQQMEKSLELDPDNPAGRQYLIRAHIRSGELKLARQQLEIALARAPNDTETLLMAVETALVSASPKKAVGYAKQLLKLDPINPKVRSLIGDACLAQARKQIRAKRADLAIKELDEALTWLADVGSRQIAAVLRALCASDASSDGLLRDAVAGFVGPLSAGFCLAMEAHRCKLEPNALFGRAGLKQSAKPDSADLANFVRLLNAVGDKEQKTIAPALACVRNLIDLAAATPLSEAERMAVCEALLRRSEYTALKTHVRAALKQSPQNPILTYFAAVAKTENKPWDLQDPLLEQLEDAHDRAERAGDQRTAHRITEFLDRDMYPDGGGMPFEPESLEIDDSQARGILKMVIQMSGPKKFMDIVRLDVGAAKFNAMKAAAGNDEQRLIDALVDYMLVSGMADALLPMGMGSMPMMLPFEKSELLPKKPSKAKPVAPVGAGQKDLFDD